MLLATLRRLSILSILPLSLLTGSSVFHSQWAVYYADRAQPAEFRAYGLVVLDSDHHPALKPLTANGATVLGYLSLCEAEQNRKWFGAVRDAGLILGEQTNWPGSHLIDIRDPRWRRIVVRELAGQILAQGFGGLFLDTLDDPAELERHEPEKFRGMKSAATELVKEIHHEFPGAVLMVNRGYELLPDLLPYIDIALGESVYGTYDFAAKTYRPVPTPEYQRQVKLLTALRARKPGLRICTLDYWDPADREGVRRVYREERTHGFDPYVTTLSLDQLTKEPR